MPAKKVQGLFSFKEMVVELVLHILYRDESGIGGTSRTERWRGVSDVINDHTTKYTCQVLFRLLPRPKFRAPDNK